MTNSQISKETLSIEGMHCASCAALIQDALLETSGVKSASVDFKSKKAVVEFDSSKISVDSIKNAIKKEGYSAK